MCTLYKCWDTICLDNKYFTFTQYLRTILDGMVLFLDDRNNSLHVFTILSTICKQNFNYNTVYKQYFKYNIVYKQYSSLN